MRNRKLTDGVRCSARQKNRHCSETPSSPDHEAEISTPAKKACLATPHKTTDKRPSKKLKCDQNSLTKSEEHGLCESGDAPSAESNPQANLDCLHSVPAVTKPKSRGRRVAKLNIKTFSSKAPFSVENDHTSCLGLTDESEDGTMFAAITQSEFTKSYSDSSPFIDEDSNQPMPLGRFFENAELMQDLPPVAHSCSSMSRREFRNLHFRAKEEEDEDEDDDDPINEENV